MGDIFRPYFVRMKAMPYGSLHKMTYKVVHKGTGHEIIAGITFPDQAQKIADAMNVAYWQGQYDMAEMIHRIDEDQSKMEV